MDESGRKWMKRDESEKMYERIRDATCISDAIFTEVVTEEGG